MWMSEGDLADLLKSNPRLRVRDSMAKPQRKKRPPARPTTEFGSYAEEVYYRDYVYPGLLSGEIAKVEMHQSFEILPALTVAGIKYQAKRYTPDFVLTFSNGRVLVVEIKGKVIKRLQRDYQLRRHLFALRYLLPNGWEFEEVAAEGLTGGKMG